MENIISTPFFLLKSMSRVPPRTLSFDFIIPKIRSTGATSGQYGARNLTCRSSSLIFLLVFIDECILALSKMIAGDFSMLGHKLLMMLSNSFKKSQNLSEFMVSTTTIAIHSPVFQVANIRLALPFNLSLMIGQLLPIGSQENCLLTDRSKLDSSQFIITLPLLSLKAIHCKIRL